MQKKHMWTFWALLVLSAGVSRADEQSYVATGQKLAETYGGAMVWLSATTKVDMGERGSQEKRTDALGVMVTKQGLVLSSLDAFDQSALIKASIQGRMPGANPIVTVVDVKITLADGTELAAEVVFKDPDLGLVYVLPQQGELDEDLGITPVPLTGAGKLGIFEKTIMLGRMTETYNREIVIIERRVASVIKKPRTYYYCQQIVPGSLAFNEKGSLVGMCVLRIRKGKDASVRPMILPLADLVDVTQQAIEAIEE
jgi:hypothetical protein